MRIAIVGPVHPYKGGISQFTSILSERLAQTDDVTVVSWKRQYPGWLYPGANQKDPDASEPLGASVEFVLDYRNPVSWVRAALLIRRWRPELVLLNWTTTFTAPIYLVMLAVLRTASVGRRQGPRRTGRRPRVVAICHNVLPHEHRPFDGALTRAVLRAVDGAVVHSASEERSLHAVAPATRGLKLFLPDFGLAREAVVDGREVRRRLGLRPRVLLFFGFVRPYKGLMYLLKAMPEIVSHLDADLLVVGEIWGDPEPYRDEVRRSGVADHVHFVEGYVPDAEVRSYFDAADVVVLPYLDATQSAVVPLAHGFGKPVITTTVGGIKEAVRDGETGILVSPGDSGELARAVVRYFTDDLGPSFAAAIARDPDRFSWATYTEAIKELVPPKGAVRSG